MLVINYQQKVYMQHVSSHFANNAVLFAHDTEKVKPKDVKYEEVVV